MIEIQIKEPGGPEVLVPIEASIPEPGESQVLIEVEASGVNRPPGFSMRKETLPITSLLVVQCCYVVLWRRHSFF